VQQQLDLDLVGCDLSEARFDPVSGELRLSNTKLTSISSIKIDTQIVGTLERLVS